MGSAFGAAKNRISASMSHQNISGATGGAPPGSEAAATNTGTEAATEAKTTNGATDAKK